jgi:hypothetical protein
MAEEIRHPDGRIEHPSVHSEPTDASFRWVFGIVVVAAILITIICCSMQFFFNYSRDALADVRQSRFPLAGEPSWSLPPEPRLEQLDRQAKVAGWTARQQAMLHTLNSIGSTEDKAYVHIPIDRALQLLADKLPVRQEEAESLRQRDNGLVNGGASNSGRLFNRRTPRWYGP